MAHAFFNLTGLQSCDGNQLVIAYIETNFSFDNKHLTETFGQLPHNLIPVSKCHSERTSVCPCFMCVRARMFFFSFPLSLSHLCIARFDPFRFRDPCSFLFICFYNLVSIYPGIRQDWIQLNRTAHRIHTGPMHFIHIIFLLSVAETGST